VDNVDYALRGGKGQILSDMTEATHYVAKKHQQRKDLEIATSALKQLAKHCNDKDYWQVAESALRQIRQA